MIDFSFKYNIYMYSIIVYIDKMQIYNEQNHWVALKQNLYSLQKHVCVMNYCSLPVGYICVLIFTSTKVSTFFHVSLHKFSLNNVIMPMYIYRHTQHTRVNTRETTTDFLLYSKYLDESYFIKVNNMNGKYHKTSFYL